MFTKSFYIFHRNLNMYSFSGGYSCKWYNLLPRGKVNLSKEIGRSNYVTYYKSFSTRQTHTYKSVQTFQGIYPLLRKECNIFRNVISRHSTSNAARKNHISKSQIRRLLSLARPERWKLSGAIVLLLVSSSITMAVPFALGKVIDIIYTTDTSEMQQNLNKLSGILVGVFLLGAICNFGRVYLMNIAGQRITNRLRKSVFSATLSQEVAFFDQNKTGELVNRLSADTQLVSQALTMNISDGLRSVVMVCAGVSMMVYMSPSLAAVGLSIVPPVAGLAVLYGRFVRKITKKVQDSLADATQVAEERISNIRTVKSFSKEDAETIEYSTKLQKVLHLAYKEALARGVFFGMTGLSGNIIILSVLYYGGVMVGESTISVGSLSSFLLYAAYIGVSIGGLSSFYSEINRGLGASARLFEIIDRQPNIVSNIGLIPPSAPKGFIVLEKINFSYPSRKDTLILNNLCLKIPEASVTAIVGASGSGKSTIAAILLRLYDPDVGTALLDGTDIKTVRPQWIRQFIGYVSQEPILFSCSIRDNILYGAVDPHNVSEDEIIAAAKEANCYEFITKTFPQGFNTLVGERGVMLSGGQKQRIAIARALIKNPRILLLDEATSALDAESEHLVQEALDRIMKGRTVLTIAHRLSTIKSADQIAVLEKGHVVETGNYLDLMSKENGTFRKLVQHQTFMTQ